MKRLALLLAVALCAGGVASAGELTREKIDQQIQSMIEGDYALGVVVGVLDGQGTRFYSYGKTAREGKSPDENTVFQIGSISKVFTATVLAQMVEKRQLEWGDSVESLLPPEEKVPSDLGNKIWLLHLAAHTSGLPPMPTNIRPNRPEDPYGDYTPQQFHEFLASYVLPRTPGDRFEYSHTGYALLGEALARKDGKGFEQMILDRICVPLGMKDTRLTMDAAYRARLAQGHTVDAVPIEPWNGEVFAPAFGFNSTAADLLKLAAAHAGVTKTPFDAALVSMQKRQVDADRNNDMGIGWQLARRFNAIWHNGEAGGFHCFLAAMPRQKSAVVVMANSATGLIDMAGISLARMVLDQPSAPLTLKTPVKLDPSALAPLVGEYRVNPTQTLTVTQAGDALYINATNQTAVRIYPETARKFFGKILDIQVIFEGGPGGTVDSLTFFQGGKQVPAGRIR